MYNRLQQLGTPHKEGLDQADKKQVFSCIKDRTGMFLTQDEHVLYVETEEEFEKPKFKFTGEAKNALKNYYNSVHKLCVCSRDFKCQRTLFKRLVTRKRQPGGQGRVSEQRSRRTLEEVAALEGGTPAKQPRRLTRTATSTTQPKPDKGRGKKGRGKSS